MNKWLVLLVIELYFVDDSPEVRGTGFAAEGVVY
jgi:hypothetical protein